jgi:hypothetical protein
MSDFTKICLLALASISVGCGSADETGSPSSSVGDESSAVKSCPNKPPQVGAACTQLGLTCDYHSKECPHGKEEFVCTQGTGGGVEIRVWLASCVGP